MASATRSPMRSRKAAPTSRFLPEIRKDMAASDTVRFRNESWFPEQIVLNQKAFYLPIDSTYVLAGVMSTRPAAANQFATALCFSRRRCTEEGIRIASRDFATVR